MREDTGAFDRVLPDSGVVGHSQVHPGITRWLPALMLRFVGTNKHSRQGRPTANVYVDGFNL